VSKLAKLLTPFLSIIASPICMAADNVVSNALCENPDYYCQQVQAGETWKTLFPSPERQALLKKINGINTELYPGMLIAIPLNVKGDSGSSFSSQRAATGQKVLIFDPSIQAWAAYDEEGNLIRTGHGSGGKDWCADVGSRCRTPAGKYAVYDKRDAGCFSRKFPVGVGGAPMPYCMFFHGGYAFHASNDVPNYHASHGCVRLFYQDARWLNLNFVDLPNKADGTRGTQVIILPYHPIPKKVDEYGKQYEIEKFNGET